MERVKPKNKKKKALKKKPDTIKLRFPKGATSSVLDKKTIKRFCKLIKKGLPFDAVCDYLGISQANYYNWKRKGDLYLAGNNQPAADAIYGYFVIKTKKALAKWRLDITEDMMIPGNRQWARNMTVLERRDRPSYSRQAPDGGDEEDYTPDERFL